MGLGGSDIIVGGAGADNLQGNTGADIILGDSGAVVLDLDLDLDLDLAMLNVIETAGVISGQQIGEELRLSRSACRRRLRRLRDEGRIVIAGSGSAIRYRLPRLIQRGAALGTREHAVLQLVVAQGQVGRDEVCESLGVSARTANRALTVLVKTGLLSARREGRIVRYEVM